MRFEPAHVVRLGVDRAVGEHRLEGGADRRGADEALAAGMHAADLVVVGPQRHQPLEVAAPQRLVELVLDVVGRDEGRGRAAWGGPWILFG